MLLVVIGILVMNVLMRDVVGVNSYERSLTFSSKQALTDDEWTSLRNGVLLRLKLEDVPDRRVWVDEDTLHVGFSNYSEEDIKNLVLLNVFEAKVGNSHVFGEEDVTWICKTPDCAGLTRQEGCEYSGGNWSCTYAFLITVDDDAAERLANLTVGLGTFEREGKEFLVEPLKVYLGGVFFDEIYIGSELKGVSAKDISISGTGEGITEREAIESAAENMRDLQVLLESGALAKNLVAQ